jgi:hypothetical protein
MPQRQLWKFLTAIWHLHTLDKAPKLHKEYKRLSELDVSKLKFTKLELKRYTKEQIREIVLEKLLKEKSTIEQY